MRIVVNYKSFIILTLTIEPVNITDLIRLSFFHKYLKDTDILVKIIINSRLDRNIIYKSIRFNDL